jgi:hypothetical protein
VPTISNGSLWNIKIFTLHLGYWNTNKESGREITRGNQLEMREKKI